MDKYYENSSPEKNQKWVVNSNCAVYSCQKNHWHRASILEVLPDDKVKVFLNDVAVVAWEPVSSLRVLDDSFSKYPNCAVKCHLSDIQPVTKHWPSISCEFLLNQLERSNEIYISRKGKTEHKSQPVQLWLHRRVSGGALEPTAKKWINLNQLLVDEGLAIPIEPKIFCSSSLLNKHDFPGKDNEKDLGKMENNILEPIFNEEDARIEISDFARASDSFHHSLATRWMPSVPLGCSRFVGRPTYVDHDAVIYMYDVEKDEGKLKLIQQCLFKEYENSNPEQEDRFWSVGQMCIVRYHLDNFWYRGQIVRENEDLSYEVLFVDYGNTETCQTFDLRKTIKVEEIPILTHKFRLQGIMPISTDSNWPEPVIDFLHSLVVDKNCEVKVLDKSSDSSQPSTISLKIIESDIEVAQFLVDEGLARFDHSLCGQSEFWLKTGNQKQKFHIKRNLV